MDYLEITGVVLGILYLFWEYKASSWLWLASIAMPAIYLDVYFRAGLYADFGISIYYILASIYGLIVWVRGRKSAVAIDGTVSHIRQTPVRLYLPLLLVSVAITIILGLLLSRYTDSTVPWADAATTALSIVALWMLARKFVEQWIVWIVVDLAYTILYTYKGLWLTGGLYFAYAVVAIFGYLKWKKLMIQETR